MIPMNNPLMRRTPIFLERYHKYEREVTKDLATAIVREADAIYAVEQGEVELKQMDGQRRLTVTMTFERIIRT
jgi:hypothetical protein